MERGICITLWLITIRCNSNDVPAKIFSAAILGLEGEIVEVEVDVLSSGLHRFTLVGLPDTSIKESRDRVSSAIKNSGFKPPHHCGRITVNLAPADLQKNGPVYDVPIILSFLIATNQLSFDVYKKLFVGEVALDGAIRSVHGALSIALLAKRKGFEEIYVPFENAQEASLADGIRVIPIRSVIQLIDHLNGIEIIDPITCDTDSYLSNESTYVFDMSHIKGQEHAKRAMEVVAAGGHNVLLSGPPGSGKTLLAKTFPSILPKLTFQESLEITQIFSVSGKLSKSEALITQRPFRSPHHSSSAVSLVGGGSSPRPGEISLAHRGVLFLDEFAEFSKNILENLRQPLEDGYITVARAKETICFPSRFILLAATNPCPCGNASDPEKMCSCSHQQIEKYRQKLSGPILDRIDLHIEVPRLKFDALESVHATESSATIRGRVESARKIQHIRFQKSNIFTNSEMSSEHIKQFCHLDDMSTQLLRQAVSTFHLSARGYHRIIKVARTIADLDGSENIGAQHIAEAIQYRFKTD